MLDCKRRKRVVSFPRRPVCGRHSDFAADDGTRGRELWAVALKETIDRIFADRLD